MNIENVITDKYALYHGDCVDVCQQLPDNSIDFTVFSPPFANLYCYSDSPNDMGNCKDYAEFFEHFAFLVKELKRITKGGRLVSVHCIDIPAMKERDGYIGLKDFPGDMIRCFQNEGFIYHSRHVIWKDPLIEATRTKAIGLMYKQIQKDSAMCRAGLPDYLLTFRNTGENETPIEHRDNLLRYCGKNETLINKDTIIHSHNMSVARQHNIWRAYASPVWMDIRQTHTLNGRAGRDAKDEKHICPLQLDVIERACVLWSNPGEVVLTPFMGVGSECYGAVLNGRKAIGIELKPSYFRQAVKNMEHIGELEKDTAEMVMDYVDDEEDCML